MSDEKRLQLQIKEEFDKGQIAVKREVYLGARDIVDFFYEGIAIEVKIKGSSKAIYRQCSRYTEYGDVEALVLVTAKAMGFPATLNGKPCYVVNLNKAWL